MQSYVTPAVNRVGSLHELTQSSIYKTSGSGDIIIISGAETPVPGKSVITVS